MLVGDILTGSSQRLACIDLTMHQVMNHKGLYSTALFISCYRGQDELCISVGRKDEESLRRDTRITPEL